jgi:hypothetical protein
MGTITDQTPTVGSVAWWRAGVYPAGSAGHVAYVEEVVSADEIVVSQDSWGGDFSWARITRGSKGWPSGFVHFNDVPLDNTVRPVVTGTAKVGSKLRASAGTWSVDGVEAAYQWRLGRHEIPGATRRNLRVTEAMTGKRIRVVVTASRLGYPTTSRTSVKTAAVLPGALTGVTAPTVTGEPRVDAPLTASPGAWSPAPDTVSYQWTADGSPVPGADQPVFTPGPDLEGATLAVTVTARKQGYADVATTVTLPAAVAPATLDVSGAPALQGTPALGETLRLATPATAPGSVRAFEWLRDGQVVPAATRRTYTVTPEDLGSRISARQTLTRPGYAPVVLTTPASTRVRTAPRLDVGLQPGRRRLVVDVAATATGLATLSGTVRVRTAGRVVAETALVDGVARLRLRGLTPGEQTFRVVLRASPATERAAVLRSVTIR